MKRVACIAQLPQIVLIFLISLCVAPLHAAARFYKPPEGYLTSAQLPAGFRAVIRVITLDRRDAFDGSVAHSDFERQAFALGNRLHIETRESTLRRRLLFAEGGAVTADLIAETERVLRTEEFLSDAILSVHPLDSGACDVMIATFDQWTTVPGVGLQVQNLKAADLVQGRWGKLLDEEWFWWAGISESNVLGTGTKLAAALKHDLLRDTRSLAATNNNLTSQRLQILAHAAWLSDGDSLVFRVNKPLLSRTDKYAYGATLTSQENSERVYFDNNLLGELPDRVAEEMAGKPGVVRLFERVATQELALTATRSYGILLKFNIGPTFTFRDHYHAGGLGEPDTALTPYVNLPLSAQAPEKRTDALAGAAVSLYKYGYRTTRNFRNLKWSESVETGWRLTTKAALNQKWLGAGDGDLRLAEEAVYTGFWDDRIYVTTGLGWQSFVSGSGHMTDGQADAWAEAALREHPLTATWVTAAWTNLFATPKSRQLSLGELNGLTGFPSYYYAGQARLLATVEQRLFPTFEWLTMVPSFAAFFNAGNTFATAQAFDAGDLHYSVGLGLRLGRSKSTQKVVQHFNVTFPIGDDYLSGPLVSVLAKKNL